MQKRTIKNYKAGSPLADKKPQVGVNYKTIAANYFPVDSAIAMRDQNNTDLQVTIMNDRAQGGSADLTDGATIELMQHRRLLSDDDRGVNEALNETSNSDDLGIQVNARYYM